MLDQSNVESLDPVDRWEKSIKEGLKELPDFMHPGILRYILEGLKPGDFLIAIFSNDFADACCRAVAPNEEILKRYALFLYNDIPSSCWGSKEKVEKWIREGGLRGRQGKS